MKAALSTAQNLRSHSPRHEHRFKTTKDKLLLLYLLQRCSCCSSICHIKTSHIFLCLYILYINIKIDPHFCKPIFQLQQLQRCNGLNSAECDIIPESCKYLFVVCILPLPYCLGRKDTTFIANHQRKLKVFGDLSFFCSVICGIFVRLFVENSFGDLYQIL